MTNLRDISKTPMKFKDGIYERTRIMIDSSSISYEFYLKMANDSQFATNTYLYSISGHGITLSELLYKLHLFGNYRTVRRFFISNFVNAKNYRLNKKSERVLLLKNRGRIK